MYTYAYKLEMVVMGFNVIKKTAPTVIWRCRFFCCRFSRGATLLRLMTALYQR